ncbi:GGDEF domain-containing protein, partial [Candidatus Micrarchaeota archaeon]|nr:GGDEF domain-containing protein [Candidatus Micrarchaeota archaeon]
MTSEHSDNIVMYLREVASKMKDVSKVSLYLADHSKEGVSLDCFAKLKKNGDGVLAPAPNGNPIEKEIMYAVEENKAVCIIKGKRKPIFVFNLKPHDFNYDKLSVQDLGLTDGQVFNGWNEKVIIPISSSNGEKNLGCLVFEGKNLKLLNRWNRMSSVSFLAFSSRLIYPTIDRLFDPLTKLFNKGAFSKALYDLSDDFISSKEEKNFTLILSDIDHFKEVNDTHGHDVGDKVLSRVSKVIRTSIRKLERDDKAYRVGGEELTIL